MSSITQPSVAPASDLANCVWCTRKTSRYSFSCFVCEKIGYLRVQRSLDCVCVVLSSFPGQGFQIFNLFWTGLSNFYIPDMMAHCWKIARFTLIIHCLEGMAHSPTWRNWMNLKCSSKEITFKYWYLFCRTFLSVKEKEKKKKLLPGHKRKISTKYGNFLPAHRRNSNINGREFASSAEKKQQYQRKRTC